MSNSKSRPYWKVFVLLALSTTVWASGELDPSFGGAGQVTVRRSGAPQADAQVGDLAVLGDGRSVWVMENGLGATAVGRLLQNGALDTSFGQGGQLLLSCARSSTTRLQPLADGALVVWTGRCLLKLDINGAEDTNFALGAVLPPTITVQQFRAAALQQDALGRFVLAGRNGNQWEVYRYLADGSNDVAFGVNGVARLSLADNSTFNAMQLLADNTIVLAGARTVSFQTNVLLYKLTASGILDTGFGTQGALELAPPAGYQGWRATALAVQTDSTLLLAGRANGQFGATDILIARISANGLLLQPAPNLLSLGSTVSLTPFGESAEAIAVLPNGRILIALTSFPPSTSNTRTRFTIMRLNANFQFDTSFGQGGWRSYIVTDPESAGQAGPYSQLHKMVLNGTQATLFGRTFFEDGAVNNDSYSTFLRVNFDVVFRDGFEG